MTGEITLSGKLIAVGGLVEKLAAASRERIRYILMPETNKSILKKVPPDILKTLNIDFIKNTDEVLEKAFEKLPLKKKKPTKKAKKKSKKKDPLIRMLEAQERKEKAQKAEGSLCGRFGLSLTTLLIM